MSTFRIDQQGGGDFQTIAQALRHCLLAQEKAPVLRLGPGVWREKLTLRIPGLTLEGAGAEKTIIVWGDSALMPDDAGVPLGTFRTATVRVHAPGVTLRNLTVRNDAGPGDRVAQAVALYLAGDRSYVEGCALEAQQDTLMMGPDTYNPRQVVPSGQRCALRDCRIAGNIDFIFGSATAWIENCELALISQRKPVNGWITAPNTPAGQAYGFVFRRCRITGDVEPASFYLGRPWREHAKCLFLDTAFPAAIHPALWMDWERPFRPVTAGFAVDRDPTGGRHPASGLLDGETAAGITPQRVLGNWVPWLSL